MHCLALTSTVLDSWFEAPVAITANDQKENLQDRVYFDSWPKSDIRSAPGMISNGASSKPSIVTDYTHQLHVSARSSSLTFHLDLFRLSWLPWSTEAPWRVLSLVAPPPGSCS